jgi:hypothetical protein
MLLRNPHLLNKFIPSEGTDDDDDDDDDKI